MHVGPSLDVHHTSSLLHQTAGLSRSRRLWYRRRRRGLSTRPRFTVLPRRSALFNDLIRPQQQRRRDGEAERLGGFEVDHEFELGRPFDWNFAGIAALENFVNVDGGPSEEVRQTRSIGHENTGLGERAPDRNRWQSMLGEELGNLGTISDEHRTAREEQTTDPLLGRASDRDLEIGGAAYFKRKQLDAKRQSHRSSLFL